MKIPYGAHSHRPVRPRMRRRPQPLHMCSMPSVSRSPMTDARPGGCARGAAAAASWPVWEAGRQEACPLQTLQTRLLDLVQKGIGESCTRGQVFLGLRICVNVGPPPILNSTLFSYRSRSFLSTESPNTMWV